MHLLKNFYNRHKVRGCEECDLQETETTDEYVEIDESMLSSLVGGGSIAGIIEQEMITSRTLYLNDAVSSESVTYMIQMIHKWNRDDILDGVEESTRPITIYFDTEGGDAYSGTALLSTIENSFTTIIGISDGGMLMSMGLPLFLSCHYRVLSKHTHVMYHTLRAAVPESTLAELDNLVTHFTRMQDSMDEYILNHTTIPKEVLAKYRNSNLDWFISFEDLKKYDFADEYLE